MLDTVPGTGAIAVIQTEKNPCLPGAYILVEAITIIVIIVTINTMLGSVKCCRKKKRMLGESGSGTAERAELSRAGRAGSLRRESVLRLAVGEG